jgi:hypothetical protein
MPATIRIRCKYIDCQFLDGLYCSKTDEVELDLKRGCLSYIPVKEETSEEDMVDEDELSEEEEEWLDLEDEEDEENEDDMRFEDYEE